MIKGFPIDFIRQALEQTLLEQHIKNPHLFGGKNQVSILSFYEQLKNQDEVDRFVETYRDLTEQQNRTGLILNGVLVSPENPTITNLYSCLIIPMSFTCSLRCKLSNRDQALETINNLIEQLKGHKVDIAQLKCVDANGNTYYTPFVVGTIGSNDGEPFIKKGDYLGEIPVQYVGDRLTYFETLGLYDDTQTRQGDWYYIGNPATNLLSVVYYNDQNQWQLLEDDGEHSEIIFPPTHTAFEKYKLSFSFEAIRCDEPRNLNGDEYCEISFGGSATLSSGNVMYGNDLVKVCVEKYGIKLEDANVVYSNPTKYWLEPLEMPSSNIPTARINQLVSNNFKTNNHTDAIALTLQYSFVFDASILLLDQWFEYGRYGSINVGTTASAHANAMSPNLIYKVTEYWSWWGNVKKRVVKTKINNDIDIENTESDTLTLGITMQIQGDND